MRILIDIGHPAHVHLFKNFAWQMEENGNEIIFTVRNKEFEIQLLKKYNFNYKSIGRHFKSRTGKIFGLLIFNFQILRVALNFKPDIFISHGSIYAAQISWILGKPHIALEDTGNLEQVRLYRPFSNSIITPTTLKKDLGPKQIRLDTYHEIAYLHPKYFQKSSNILGDLNINQDSKYCVIRLVSWNATHDLGKIGLSSIELRDIISFLSGRMKIMISSERILEPDLEMYRFNLSPDLMHDALAYSSLVISEGATLAAESGFLGIPTIYVNPQETCNNKELEENGCVVSLKDGRSVLECIKSIVSEPYLIREIKQRADSLVSSKINLTLFLIWFVSNFPESMVTMRENSDYQYNFK